MNDRKVRVWSSALKAKAGDPVGETWPALVGSAAPDGGTGHRNAAVFSELHSRSSAGICSVRGTRRNSELLRHQPIVSGVFFSSQGALSTHRCHCMYRGRLVTVLVKILFARLSNKIALSQSRSRCTFSQDYRYKYVTSQEQA